MISGDYRGKPPVLGWSFHMTGGWRGQLQRVERWHSRFVNAQSEHDQIDYLFAFFEASFALRDWLIDTGAAPQMDLERLFQQHVELRLNRDIANLLKHHSISRPSQEQPPSLICEYAPERPSFGVDRSLLFLSEGASYDAIALATRCLGIWSEYADRLSRA